MKLNPFGKTTAGKGKARKAKAGIVALGLALIGGIALADSHRMDRMSKHLNLTSEQEQAFTELHQNKQAQRATMQTEREAVRALVAQGDTDAAADLAASQARERVYSMAEHRAALAEILTEEQLQTFEAMREQRTERRRERRSRSDG